MSYQEQLVNERNKGDSGNGDMNRREFLRKLGAFAVMGMWPFPNLIKALQEVEQRERQEEIEKKKEKILDEIYDFFENFSLDDKGLDDELKKMAQKEIDKILGYLKKLKDNEYSIRWEINKDHRRTPGQGMGVVRKEEGRAEIVVNDKGDKNEKGFLVTYQSSLQIMHMPGKVTEIEIDSHQLMKLYPNGKMFFESVSEGTMANHELDETRVTDIPSLRGDKLFFALAAIARRLTFAITGSWD